MRKKNLISKIIVGALIVSSAGYILFMFSPLAGFSYKTSDISVIAQNNYAYENEQHMFGFELPQSYIMDDRQFNTQGFMHVTKNAEWDKESGAPLKGSIIYITSKKIVGTLKEHVNTENKDFQGLVNDQISEISINNHNAIVFDAGNGVSIKYPGVKSFYIQNQDEVLEFTLMMGAYTTKEEFDEYVREFDEIVLTIYFL